MATTRRRVVQACLAAPLLVAKTAQGQPGSIESAQIIIGFPAGSTVDVVARRVAEELRTRYASTVLVDNRSGAGGQLALTAVKASRPDGSVILLTPMAMLSVYPFTYRKLPYDPVGDFAPVTQAVVYDRAFSVGPAVPESVRTIPQFIDWARANPACATFGSPAAGSPLHFTGVLIGRALGLELVHAPYRGSTAAIPDLAEGRLPAFVCPLGDIFRYRADGKVRILGTSGATRSPFTPDVATFGEQGLKGLGFPEGYSFFLPAKSPRPVIDRLNTAIRRALTAPGMKEGLASSCMEPEPTTPEQLQAIVERSIGDWGPVVKSIGFSADT